MIAPPARFKIDPYYTKFTFAREFTVLGSRQVRDESLLRANDIIRKFHGEPISFESFAKRIIRIRPGTVVPIEVQRDGETVSLKIKIGLRPDDYPFPLPTLENNPPLGPNDLPPP